MARLDDPLPRGGKSREHDAQRQIEATTASAGVVPALVAFFLIASASVPIAEWATARAGGDGVQAAWAALMKVPAEIGAQLSGVSRASRSDELRLEASVRTEPFRATLWGRMVAANRTTMASLNGFERALEDQSLLARSLRPPTQVLMTRWLGAGNERVYPGRNGWLFYRADVEYVTGRPFLARSEIKRRIAAAPEWTLPPQPDPRRALMAFKRDLDARGITLVVVPTPHKPGVHPEHLARRLDDVTEVMQNPSYRVLVDDLTRAGVLFFDPSAAMAAARGTGPQYLATDSHWRPETMELVAEQLATFITARVALPSIADPGYQIARVETRNVGDTARMLDLPDRMPLFPAEAVWLRRILQMDGSPWRSSRDADVLLLGDSFSNIYTLESLGWGTAAGLAEQLSYALRRPIDRIVQNDEGAFATRAALARDPDRLNGKRVVVYQFAARELAFGDWKILSLD